MLPAQLYTQVPRGALGGSTGGVLLYELQRHQIVVARARGGKALLAAKGSGAEINLRQAEQLAGLDIRQAELNEGAFRHTVGLGEDIHRRGNLGGIGLQCVHACKSRRALPRRQSGAVRACG